MFRDIFRELIPINLINLMVVIGFQFLSGVPRHVPVDVDTIGVAVPFAPGLQAFWFFPALASVVYIVLTIFQFFYRALFVPKTVLIFFLANLHVALILQETGKVKSLIIPMVPAVVVIVTYVVVILTRRSQRDRVSVKG